MCVKLLEYVSNSTWQNQFWHTHIFMSCIWKQIRLRFCFKVDSCKLPTFADYLKLVFFFFFLNTTEYTSICTRFCPAPWFPFCTARLYNKTRFHFSIPSWQEWRFQPIVCTILLVTLGIVVWTQLKVSGHFLVFSFTAPCKKETNMVVKSAVTCKIGLIWCQMKTLYWLLTSIL